MAGGHLFIVDGDITKLSCDAWLLPTDVGFNIAPYFQQACQEGGGTSPSARRWNGDRFQELPPDSCDRPRIILGDVGRPLGTAPSVFAELATEFVRWTVAHLPAYADSGQTRRLLALPLLGGGQGGAEDRLRLSEVLVDALASAASESDVDIVLVTHGREGYSAAQRARQKLLAESGGPRTVDELWELGSDSDRLLATAGELARKVRSGELVLFIGAGASVNAGLPDWAGLLAGIAGADDIAFLDDKAFKALDFRDQAALLEGRLGAEGLEALITSTMSSVSRYSITHALMASLRVPEAVTTNYDVLYETAFESFPETLTVIPGTTEHPGHPWLLKLHGSVTGEDGFIITREDFLEVASRHAALLGLLQAVLLTRTMLFIGYSLKDEDFHSVMNDVRKVTRGKRLVGTALTLERNGLLEELWRPEISVVRMAEAREESDSDEAARRLQIFLDLVAFKAADLSRFLLADGYQGALTSGEQRLRSALERLKHDLPENSETPGMAAVRRLLHEFGDRSGA